MTLLDTSQIAVVKSRRSKLWTRPFTVETPGTAQSGTYYDEPFSGNSGAAVLSGDWVWRDQSERRGSAGGVYDTAHLLLNADIVHSGSLVAGTRVLVDGIRCGIVAVSPYPESGELVMAAVKV